MRFGRSRLAAWAALAPSAMLAAACSSGGHPSGQGMNDAAGTADGRSGTDGARLPDRDAGEADAPPPGDGEAADGAVQDGSGLDASALEDAGLEPGVTDPGRSVSMMVRASQGATILVPDGAELVIPPGALPHDLMLTVSVPTGQSSASKDLTYIFEPPGIVLNAPATLSIPTSTTPAPQDLVTAFVSSGANPIVAAIPEVTNWIQADALVGTASITVQLHDFTFVYVTITVDPDHRTYLVTDIPSQYLHAGDLLFTLTTYGGSLGPNWVPGHVAAFVGSNNTTGVAVDRIVEANGARVDTSRLNALEQEPGHIYLGPRRPHTPLTQAQQAAITTFLLAQVGKGYALVGEQSISSAPPDPNSTFSCVGLCEKALQSVGSGTLNWFRRATVPTPIEQYRATDDVSEIEVCPGDDVKIPIYGVVVDHNSPFIGCMFRGAYSRLEPYTVTWDPLPPNTDITAGQVIQGAPGYLLEFAPDESQAGATFRVGLHMRASRVKCTTGLFDETVDRTLTFNVKATTPGSPGAPSVSGVSAMSANWGDRVVISGANLGGPVAVVRFNGLQAQVESSTSTTVVVRVPDGATTGPLTLAANCAVVEAVHEFTVNPSSPYYTTYQHTAQLVLMMGNACNGGPWLGTQPYEDGAYVGSDGSFYFTNMARRPGTIAANGTFDYTEMASFYSLHYTGKILQDGNLTSGAMVATLQPTSVYPMSCWGDTETYSVRWTPETVDYLALIAVSFTDRCPYNENAPTVFEIDLVKTVATNALVVSSRSRDLGGFSASTTLDSGGVFHAVATNYLNTVPMPQNYTFTIDGTVRVDGTGTGTITRQGDMEPCHDSGTFTLMPLSPVTMSLP